MKTTKYTEKELIDAVATSTSYRQVLLKLKIKPAGGNYQVLKSNISKLNLDTSHFQGKAWSKGKKIGPRKSLNDYLNNKYSIHSYKLKQRLLNENIFKNKCYNCNFSEWLNAPIPLELHHIDGNNSNNNLSNLILLCPNCHALTSNYRGKNIK